MLARYVYSLFRSSRWLLTCQRGIDVMIEMDMPGHTASIAESHPEHIACYGKAWDVYALQPPSGQLRFANEDTTQWAAGLVSELVKNVKGPYMGTGGDELNKKCMVSNHDDVSGRAELIG